MPMFGQLIGAFVVFQAKIEVFREKYDISGFVYTFVRMNSLLDLVFLWNSMTRKEI